MNIVKISSLAVIIKWSIRQLWWQTDACVEVGATDLLNADRGSSGERQRTPSYSLIPCHNSAAVVRAIVLHHAQSSRPAAVAYTCRPLYIPYILAYKPTIFSWILTIKLWGSAYMRVIAQQPELARHRPRHGPLVGTCRRPVRGRRQDHTQTAAAVSAYQCSGLHCGRWTHRRTSACVRGASACGAIIGVCTDHAGWQCTDQGYSFIADCRYQLIHESLVFARLSDAGMGVGLYAGRLIREYVRYLKNLHCIAAYRLVKYHTRSGVHKNNLQRRPL